MTATTSVTPRTHRGRLLRDALRSAERRLEAAGVPSPRGDAELLAAHLLGVPRTGLWSHLEHPVPVGFDDLVAARADRIPVQHLTGWAYFRSVTLAVGPGVFCPRPETELVAGHGLRVLAESGVERPTVVDLCSGSGAIAAAISVEAPQAWVHAVERDPGAWPWLARNADALGFTPHLDDLEGCLEALNGTVDLVVANPPYIPEGSVPRDPEVARFDPDLALYSGPDGLTHCRLVERAAARLVRPGGWVVVEHGDLQGTSVPAIFEATGAWTEVTDNLDLAGRDRYVSARRTVH
jgi:release factor glutamine methyltransferase